MNSTVLLGKSAALDGDDADQTPAVRLVPTGDGAFALAVSQIDDPTEVAFETTTITNGASHTVPPGRRFVDAAGGLLSGAPFPAIPFLPIGLAYPSITITAPPLGSITIIEVW